VSRAPRPFGLPLRWLALALALLAGLGETAEPSRSVIPPDAELIVDVPFEAAPYSAHLNVLRHRAESGGDYRYYVLPPLVQTQPVVALPGALPGAMRYVIAVGAAPSTRVADAVRNATGPTRPEPVTVDYVTISAPEVNFVRTFRGQQLAPLGPETSMTVAIDVEAELVPAAERLLRTSGLRVDVKLRFGPPRVVLSTVTLDHARFLGTLRPALVLEGRSAYRQSDIQNQLAERKRGAPEVIEWWPTGLRTVTQLTLAELLGEWFEELVPDPATSDTRGGARQSSPHPYWALLGSSEGRLFMAKDPPPQKDLEAFRFLYFRPSRELVNSLPVMIQPPPPPAVFGR